jgi:hypothetical protein
MSIDFSYLLRKDEPGTQFRDLDDVALLAPVTLDDGSTIPVGCEGTVVGVWRGGEAFFVEFPEPEGAVATVRPQDLRRVGRYAA